MPTYDYVCDACGHELELFQSITAPAKRKCPACAKSKLRRRIGSGGGILFKGKGFYQTDYRSASYQAGVKGEGNGSSPSSNGSSESKGSEPGSGPKADSKPAPKPPEPAAGASGAKAPKGPADL